MEEGEEKKTRYDELKEKLIGKEDEVEELEIEVASKDMLEVYEKNTILFLEKLGKNLDEFESLLEEFKDYDGMTIVQKALRIIDSYEPLLFNLRQEKDFLFAQLKNLKGMKAKKDTKFKKQESAPEDVKIDAILALKEKGYSNRRIAETLGTTHPTIARMLENYENIDNGKSGKGGNSENQ